MADIASTIKQTATKSVYATISPTKYPYTFTSYFEEKSYNIDTNKSKVYVKGTLYGKDINYSVSSELTLYIYWIDNNKNTTKKIVDSLVLKSTTKGKTYTVEGTIEVEHKSDGSLNGYAQLYYDGSESSSSYAPPNTTLNTANTKLTTIPRAAACPSGTYTIGSVHQIIFTPKSTSFTHKLLFSIGSKSYELSAAAGVKYFELDLTDENIYTLFDSATYTATATLETYNGSSKVGSSTGKIVVQCDENICRPTINATYKDNNENIVALTGDNQKILKGRSTLLIEFDASSEYSTIEKITVNKNLVDSVESYTETNPRTETYEIIAYDKRDFPSEPFLLTIDLVEYVNLSVVADFVRTAPTTGKVKLEYSGDYFNSTFGAESNELNVSYQYREYKTTTWSDPITLTPTITDNTYSQTIELDETFNYKKPFELLLTVSDKLDSLPVTKIIPRGEPMFWTNDEYVKFINTVLLSSGNEVLDYEVVEEW